MEITVREKIAVVKSKLASHRQAYYSHTLDARIAKDIGGLEDVVKKAEENMKQVLEWITPLELELIGLEESLSEK